MAIKVTCACGKLLSVKDEFAGRKVKCPACQQTVGVSNPVVQEEAFHEEWGKPDPAEDIFLFDDDPIHTPHRKVAAGATQQAPVSAELRLTRASLVRAGVSCYFFGFLLTFFAMCYLVVTPTLHQGNVRAFVRAIQGVIYVNLLAEVIIAVGLGLCLTAPPTMRRRDILLLAILSSWLGVLSSGAPLWNPFINFPVGRGFPVIVSLTTQVSFALFVRGLGEFIGDAEIKRQATRVAVFLSLFSVSWLGMLCGHPLHPHMIARGAIVVTLFTLAMLAVWIYTGIMGFFQTLRLLSTCRAALRNDAPRVASHLEHDSSAIAPAWLSRADVLKLGVGGVVVGLSFWGLILQSVKPAGNMMVRPREIAPSGPAQPTGGLATSQDEIQQSQDKLKAIGQAIQKNLTNGFVNTAYPAGYSDAEGQLILSWRVAILPALGENELFAQFRLDEPWDSDHNHKLIPKMPAVFQPVRGESKAGHTYYRGFAGTDAMFPLKSPKVEKVPHGERECYPVSCRAFRDTTDGTSNTLLIAEGAESVPWTKPEELTCDAKQPPPKLGGQFDGDFVAMLCDGAVMTFSRTVSEESRRTAIHPADGVRLRFKAGDGRGYHIEVVTPQMVERMYALSRLASTSPHTSTRDVRDGIDQTVFGGMVAETRSVPWTKPDDLLFDDTFQSRENALVEGAVMFGNGSIRHMQIQAGLDRTKFRSLFTIGGGEPDSLTSLYPPGHTFTPLTYKSVQDQVRQAEARSANKNSLKEIMLAFHNYHEIYNHFPPAVVYGPDGKPWHSWRVVILPFIGHNALYEQYDGSVPWDHPNNATVLTQMPSVYRDPLSDKPDSHKTPYLLVTGAGTAFPTKPASNAVANAPTQPSPAMLPATSPNQSGGLIEQQAIVAAASQPEYLTPERRKQNLLVGGTFEDGSGGTWKVNTWRQNKTVATVVSGEAKEGRKSVAVRSPLVDDDAMYEQTVGVKPNMRYLLSGWIKTKDVVVVEPNGQRGANLSVEGFQSEVSRSLQGTNDWSYVTLIVDSGQRTELTVRARLGFHYSTAKGEAWFDDLCLIPLGTSPVRPGTQVPPPTPGPATKDNMLVNGSFEEGPAFPENFGYLPSVRLGSTDIKGWTVTRGSIDVTSSRHWLPGHGQRSIDLHGTPGFGGVKQTFKTVAGQRYQVSFLMAGTPLRKQPIHKLAVSAADTQQEFSFDATGRTPLAVGWERKSWEFIAMSSETTLEIHTLETEDRDSGPILDDVSVIALGANNPGQPLKPEEEPTKSTANWKGWSKDTPPPAIAPFDASQAKQHQEAWAKHLGVPVEYTNSIGMKFVLIPPGEFTMGSTPEETAEAQKHSSADDNERGGAGVKSEGPQHKVVLTKPYYLGAHEVRQQDYESVTGVNPSIFSRNGPQPAYRPNFDTSTMPVESVSWNDATDFCTKLSVKEKLKPHYSRTGTSVMPLEGHGYRLPSEAEWEYACRAGTTTRAFFAKEEDASQFAWLANPAGGRPYPVGQLKSNPFGLFDIYGNNMEWVQDGWTPNSYEQYADKPAVDPATTFVGATRMMMRGVVWPFTPAGCRSSSRHSEPAGNRRHFFGVRAALSVEAVKAALANPSTTSRSTSRPPAREERAGPT